MPGSHKLLTCIIESGRGAALIEELRSRGVASANLHLARGLGKGSKVRRGMALYVGREIVTVLADAARADELFDLLYRAAGIAKPHAGMLLMEKVYRAEPLRLPDLPDER